MTITLGKRHRWITVKALQQKWFPRVNQLSILVMHLKFWHFVDDLGNGSPITNIESPQKNSKLLTLFELAMDLLFGVSLTYSPMLIIPQKWAAYWKLINWISLSLDFSISFLPWVYSNSSHYPLSSISSLCSLNKHIHTQFFS